MTSLWEVGGVLGISLNSSHLGILRNYDLKHIEGGSQHNLNPTLCTIRCGWGEMQGRSRTLFPYQYMPLHCHCFPQLCFVLLENFIFLSIALPILLSYLLPSRWAALSDHLSFFSIFCCALYWGNHCYVGLSCVCLFFLCLNIDFSQGTMIIIEVMMGVDVVALCDDKKTMWFLHSS